MYSLSGLVPPYPDGDSYESDGDHSFFTSVRGSDNLHQATKRFLGRNLRDLRFVLERHVGHPVLPYRLHSGDMVDTRDLCDHLKSEAERIQFRAPRPREETRGPPVHFGKFRTLMSFGAAMLFKSSAMVDRSFVDWVEQDFGLKMEPLGLSQIFTCDNESDFLTFDKTVPLAKCPLPAGSDRDRRRVEGIALLVHFQEKKSSVFERHRDEEENAYLRVDLLGFKVRNYSRNRDRGFPKQLSISGGHLKVNFGRVTLKMLKFRSLL